MTLLVDTSVWSLALRRDEPQNAAEVAALRAALESGETVVTTGLILQELLQGFIGPKDRPRILASFAALPLLQPDREDHVGAANVRNACRRAGIQIGTVDALIVQLCIRHGLTLLSVDQDFRFAARHTKLKVWSSGT